jgi:hypothetical protein
MGDKTKRRSGRHPSSTSEPRVLKGHYPPPFPKDEVKRAIERRGNCRIPQLWRPIPLIFRNEALYGFFETWPNDLVPLVDPEHDPRAYLRIVREKNMAFHGSSAVEHVASGCRETLERFDELFVEPSKEWKSALRAQLAQTAGAYHSALLIGLLFEPMYWLTGMQRFFMDLYDNRDAVEQLLDRLLDWQIKVTRACAEVGADGILTSDDWGAQRSLLIDPEMWREMFKPRYKTYMEAAHKAGLHIIFHSDGNLDSVFPDLVEIGFDVINPLQPGAMDVDRWVKLYKGKISFYTGIDVQGMLPFVSPDKVRDEVHRSVEKFHDKNGGLILGSTNAITAEVPHQNLVALYETLLEYR